jgi:hypothetical protein
MVGRVVGASIAMGLVLSLVSDLTTKWLQVSNLPELAVRVGRLLAGLSGALLLFGALVLLQVKCDILILKFEKAIGR